MSINFLILLFFGTFLLSLGLTFLVLKFAKITNIVDKPSLARKRHQGDIPLLGGLAIFIAFFLMLFIIHNRLLVSNLEWHHWLGFFVGACWLMVGGFLDDKYDLKPSRQIIWPVLAAVSLIIGGVEIEKITNPFGGYFFLNSVQFDLFHAGAAVISVAPISAILIFLWLLGMMYTTKLLDGIDGLVTGVSAIGSLIIFLFTMTTRYYQPDIGMAALIFAGACFGFLLFNWHPAKIFLGEGGSLLLGYVLGVLAIISGGKIAIALLIMGLPILDVAWTIVRRLRIGKNPFKFADRQHLHFRLLDLGFSPPVTVSIYCSFALIFGLSAVFLQSLGKFFALVVLLLIMLGFVVGFNFLDKRHKQNKI
jgi:UDP-GlcNAc:undecaprenyl-phosphate GlcNAc-1-phosphate transferase